MNEAFKNAKIELEIAENQFDRATGDAVDSAIERYNIALSNYNKIFNKENLEEVN